MASGLCWWPASRSSAGSFVVAELCQRGLAHVDGLHPMKEIRLGAGELESDLGALSAVICELSRPVKVLEGHVLPGKLLGAPEIEQQRYPLCRRWRLGQCPP